MLSNLTANEINMVKLLFIRDNIVIMMVLNGPNFTRTKFRFNTGNIMDFPVKKWPRNSSECCIKHVCQNEYAVSHRIINFTCNSWRYPSPKKYWIQIVEFKLISSTHELNSNSNWTAIKSLIFYPKHFLNSFPTWNKTCSRYYKRSKDIVQF